VQQFLDPLGLLKPVTVVFRHSGSLIFEAPFPRFLCDFFVLVVVVVGFGYTVFVFLYGCCVCFFLNLVTLSFL